MVWPPKVSAAVLRQTLPLTSVPVPSVVVPSCIRGQGSVVLLAKIEQIVNDPANACNP